MMRYVTFNVLTPVGPVERVGCLTTAGTLVDLNLAYRHSLLDRIHPQRAAAIADVVVPNDLSAPLGNRPLARDAIAAALQALPAHDVRTVDQTGATLVYPREDVRLLPPIPRPTSGIPIRSTRCAR